MSYLKYVASVSFGKDSLAMLLKLLEKHQKLDEVIFYDTGMEFEAIYNIRNIIKDLLEIENIQFTELKPKYSFEWKMLQKEVHKRDGTFQCGYGLCGGKCRWGTSEKNNTINKYLKAKYGNDYIEYIGIAIDEPKRIEKFENNIHKIMPLVLWGMSEKECLNYCYSRGFNWNENGVELYSILDRVSCWCCANKNLKELENYKKYLPDYYKQLKLLCEIIIRNAENHNNEKLKENTEKFYNKIKKAGEENV